MPAKKKSAKSARKIRDLKPSKDAKGGRRDLKFGPVSGRRGDKNL